MPIGDTYRREQAIFPHLSECCVFEPPNIPLTPMTCRRNCLQEFSNTIPMKSSFSSFSSCLELHISLPEKIHGPRATSCPYSFNPIEGRSFEIESDVLYAH